MLLELVEALVVCVGSVLMVLASEGVGKLFGFG
jgi:hypothetical protein